jgi:hypothetical protein
MVDSTLDGEIEQRVLAQEFGQLRREPQIESRGGWQHFREFSGAGGVLPPMVLVPRVSATTESSLLNAGSRLLTADE